MLNDLCKFKADSNFDLNFIKNNNTRFIVKIVPELTITFAFKHRLKSIQLEKNLNCFIEDLERGDVNLYHSDVIKIIWESYISCEDTFKADPRIFNLFNWLLLKIQIGELPNKIPSELLLKSFNNNILLMNKLYSTILQESKEAFSTIKSNNNKVDTFWSIILNGMTSVTLIILNVVQRLI